jgi:hypothetical protein
MCSCGKCGINGVAAISNIVMQPAGGQNLLAHHIGAYQENLRRTLERHSCPVQESIQIERWHQTLKNQNLL